MKTGDIYEYKHFEKRLGGLIEIGIILSAIFLLFLYFSYFKDTIILEDTFIGNIISFFKNQISNPTYLGAFTYAITGGLFFIPAPMELIYSLYITKLPNIWFTLLIYLTGISLAYMFNFFIGSRFSFIGKKLISAKKFYEIKTLINHYGKWAVFLSAATPLPGQIVSFVVGVFNYNKTKFFFQMTSGLIIKLIVITFIWPVIWQIIQTIIH